MSGQDDDYILISTNVIPQVTEVRLYADTKEKVRRGHREVPILLPCIEQATINAITNPTSVEKSYGNSFVFIDSDTTNQAGDPMQVPVKVIDGTSARARSVYFAESDEAEAIYKREGADE